MDTAIFVGDNNLLSMISYLAADPILSDLNICKENTFDRMLEIVREQGKNVAFIIMFDFDERFVEPLSTYPGPLPPIIYVRLNLVHKIPERPGIFLVDGIDTEQIGVGIRQSLGK